MTESSIRVASLDQARILLEIADERRRQDAKWGRQDHPDGTGPDVTANEYTWLEEATDARSRCQRRDAAGNVTWLDILYEEVTEAFAERDPARLRNELVQVAAVAVQWVERIDERLGRAQP